MPRISAPTVAAHRAAQRAALIDATEALLLADGIAAVTPRSVCERSGLGRSSFYDYFPSRDDLLVAVAIDAIERWDQEIDEALVGVEPGLPQLRCFVDRTMQMTADGRHELAGALREAELSPSSMDDVMRLHEALMRPILHVVQHLGVPEPHRHAYLVQGVVGAGIQLISHGSDPIAVADDVYALLTQGLPRA